MNKLVGLIIFVLALAYLIYNIKLDDLLVGLNNYSYMAILYIIVITILSFVILAFRWQGLTHSKLNFYNAYKTNLASMAINQLVPARAGDIYKPIYIKKHYNIPLVGSISAVIVERSLDLLALSLIGLTVLSGTVLFESFYFLLSMSAFMIFFIFIFFRYPQQVIAMQKKIKNKKIKNSFLRITLNIYKMGVKIFVEGMLITFALYVFYLLSLYYFLYFFTEFNLTFSQVMIVFAASALGLSLPTSPAGIGVYEASVVYVLGYYGIGGSEALSFAIVYHIIQILSIITMWYLFILSEDKYVS